MSNFQNADVDLRASLEAFMDRTKNEDELEGRNKIKTYIIESNLPEVSTKLLRGTFGIQDTTDDSLKILQFTLNKKLFSFYLDVAENRFWKLYSTIDSSTTEKCIRRLVEANYSRLDYLWLPSTMLERYMDLGNETGFGLKFKNKFNDFDDEVKDVSMRFWGGGVKEIIDGLRRNEKIERGISISSIGINYSVEGGYSKENISNKGRFTLMKGDSLDSHFNILERIRSDYSRILTILERDYRFSLNKYEYGLRISGSPLCIEFGEEIANMDKFVEVLFSSRLPFRLSGIIEKGSRDYFRVYGIDLHSNDLVNFEITPEWMEIYLSRNSCGNVITRLVTNMQMHMTSKIKLMGDGNGRII